jgi:hypothetical protein
MKEVEKKDTPDVSGGYFVGDCIPCVDPDYPQTPMGPIPGPTCPNPDLVDRT